MKKKLVDLAPGGFLFRSLVSTFDQALLSALNFAVGLALVRLTSKDAYGYFSLLYSAGMLCTGMLEAVVGSVVTTRAAAMSEPEARRFVAQAARLQWSLAALLSGLVGVAAAVGCWQVGLDEPAWLVGLAYGLFVFAFSAREYCRTTLFIQSRATTVAVLDASFALLVLGVGGAWVGAGQSLNVAWAVGMLALGNALASAPSIRHLWTVGRGISPVVLLDMARSLWRLGQWGLAGAVIAWVGNNAYLYMAGALLGMTASADLNSSRLLLAPVGLLSAAWIRIARPAAGALIAKADWAGLKRFSWRSVLALSAVNGSLVALLVLTLPWLIPHLLGPRYERAGSLALVWGAYFFVTSTRDVGTTLLMSLGEFKVLFVESVVALCFLLPLAALFMSLWGAYGGLLAMIVVELGRLGLDFLYLLPKSKRRHQHESASAHER